MTPVLNSFAYNLTKSIDDAKDLYQESFIAVWNNLKTNKFQPKNETALQGYLYQIAKKCYYKMPLQLICKKSITLGNFDLT